MKIAFSSYMHGFSLGVLAFSQSAKPSMQSCTCVNLGNSYLILPHILICKCICQKEHSAPPVKLQSSMFKTSGLSYLTWLQKHSEPQKKKATSLFFFSQPGTFLKGLIVPVCQFCVRCSMEYPSSSVRHNIGRISMIWHGVRRGEGFKCIKGMSIMWDRLETDWRQVRAGFTRNTGKSDWLPSVHPQMIWWKAG